MMIHTSHEVAVQDIQQIIIALSGGSPAVAIACSRSMRRSVGHTTAGSLTQIWRTTA
jgi:hypothetical protein